MRLTDRTSLTTAALNDLMHIVDISDKTDSDEGTSKKIRIDDMGFQLYSQRGKANGYTPLNSNVKIDTQYLPSYVDDVLEFTSLAAFPTTGEAGKIYIAKDSNFCYRWSGTVYVQVGGGGSGDVETVFGRMGNIVAAQGDYKTSLITNDSNVSGAYLDDALDWLNANKVPTSRTITAGLHLSGGGNLTQNRTLTLTPNVGNWIIDSQGNSRMYFGSETDGTNGVVIEASNPTQQLQYRNSDNNTVFRVFNSGFVSANSGAGFSGNVTSNGFITNSIGTNANSIISNISEGALFTQVSGTGSINFPTTFGQSFGVRGDTDQRSFFFYKPNGDNNVLYFSDYRGSQWRHQQIWHSNNSRSDSQNDSRYAIMNDTSQNNGQLTINTDNNLNKGLRLRNNTTLQSSFLYMDDSDDLNINNSSSSSRPVYINKGGTGGMKVGGDVSLYSGGAIKRYSHNSGYLEGSYQTVGANSANTNPIYVIGSAYTPTDTTLENMYGIGFSQGGSASFINSTQLQTNPSNGWGMYLAAAGNARIFLDASNGNGYFRGGIYADRGVFRGTVTGSNLSGTNTGDQIAGTGLSGTSTLSVTNIAAGSSTSGALRYNGTTKSAGRLYGGSSNPSSTTRLNYDGHLYVAELTSVGTITANGFYESSDRRLKENIVPLNYGLKEIKKIDTHTWNWKKDGTEDMGVIAQELEKVMPELVRTDEEGFKSVNYPKLIPVLINAIKELSNGKKS